MNNLKQHEILQLPTSQNKAISFLTTTQIS
jgi:hypothetical protein